MSEEILTEELLAEEYAEKSGKEDAPTEENEYDELPSLSLDTEELKKEFPELDIEDIEELPNLARYSELRAMGLTPAEAYLATAPRREKCDNRSHLSDSAPRAAASPSVGMTRRDMAAARELFSDLSDSEIHKLYKKVTR